MLYRQKKGIKVITIHGETYNRLCDLSRIPDSFDSVISRLLDFYESRNNNNNRVRGAAVNAK
jgi:predicted CopG family antitoxin